MRQTFRGYYRPSKEEFSELWGKCIFILDTNVLLDLYRYPKEAREDLLTILKKVSERLWVPHQVGLEYQENRLSVIAEQVKVLSNASETLDGIQKDLRKELDNLQLKERHSVVDPDDIFGKVEGIFNEFRKELERLEREQPDINDDDKLRDEIDSLLEGRVGRPPNNQEELDKIYEDGKIRYEQKRPPGYEDLKKANRPPYLYGGLVFKREYGDLVLWHQIIAEAEAREEFKHIILVIGDRKKDWWWKEKSGESGDEIIGPRPELVEEIRSKAGVSLFYMYTPERFMEWAKKYLEVPVREESIKQARDIASVDRMRDSSSYRAYEAYLVEDAVYQWLLETYDPEVITHQQRIFAGPLGVDIQPDFVINDESWGSRIAVEVKAAHGATGDIVRRVHSAWQQMYKALEERLVTDLMIVVVADSKDRAIGLERSLSQLYQSLPGIHVVLGYLDSSDQFVKFREFGISDWR